MLEKHAAVRVGRDAEGVETRGQEDALAPGRGRGQAFAGGVGRAPPPRQQPAIAARGERCRRAAIAPRGLRGREPRRERALHFFRVLHRFGAGCGDAVTAGRAALFLEMEKEKH